MALKATIFKAALHIADMGRNYYDDHAVTMARHPSENDERMMVRLLAFALHANEALVFAKGLSADDEPDLWQKDLTGAIDIWIDVGQPDEKRIRKACGRSGQVFIYCFSGHSADVWWEQIRGEVERVKNLTIINLPSGASRAMANLAQRTMDLQYTIQDGQVWITAPDATVHVILEALKTPLISGP